MEKTNTNEFVNWLNTELVVFESHEDENYSKAIGLRLRDDYVFVSFRGRLVLTTPSPERAVELYNKIDQFTVFEE